jgi:hypothetical protein
MTRDSDIDLLIVEPAPARVRQESVRIRRALGDLGFAVDVVVISTERFEETKNIFGGIAYPCWVSLEETRGRESLAPVVDLGRWAASRTRLKQFMSGFGLEAPRRPKLRFSHTPVA